VIASKNPEHVRDELAQRETWAKSKGSNVIWLKGGKKTRFDNDTHSLFVEIEESYENILEKTILGIEWCNQNIEFDFLIRANVSSYFRINKIETFLSTRLPNSDLFGGYMDVWSNPRSMEQKFCFVNGGAIFMSKSVAKELLRMDLSSKVGDPDDVAISRHLIGKGIKPTWIPRGNQSSTGIFTNRMYYRLKSSINSEISTIRMYQLDLIFLKSNPIKRLDEIFRLYIIEIRHFTRNFPSPTEYIRSIYSVLLNTWRFRKNR
jgi:hypothetical protein